LTKVEGGAWFPEVTVAATGTAWVGSGVGSVNTAVEGLLEKSRSEIQIAVYDLTGGADEFLNLLRGVLARGVLVTMVVNRLGEKGAAVREGLGLLARRFGHFQLFDFTPADRLEDLHAKIIVRDRKEALVGSANLTWRGLVRNHELAVVVSGTPASTVAHLIDVLTRDPRVRRVG
jgi:PLD-like domain